MGVVRKQYSQEFKQEAVRLVIEEGLSVAQTARDLGIAENVLHRWKKELSQHGTKAFPSHGQPIESELARLRREVEVLKREREIPKQATIFSPNTIPRAKHKAQGGPSSNSGFLSIYIGPFSIEAMCRVLRVSRSGFYDFKACTTNQGDKQDRELKAKIQLIFQEYEGRYGSPRIHLELRDQGFRCSQKRVSRLMQELELAATKPRRFVVTTDRPAIENNWNSMVSFAA